MKNLFLSGVFFLSMLSIPADANAVTIDNTSDIDFAKCIIKETRGSNTFYASGNCSRVMKAYKEWVAMQ